MKLIKNLRKRKYIKYKIKTRLEFEKTFKEKSDHLSKLNQIAIDSLKQKNQKEITQVHDFYKIEFNKIESKIEEKYKNIIQLRDNRILELENYVNDIKETFQYLKEREQDLENVINLVGTKYKGFWEQVANAYAGAESIASHINKYNKKHLKNDTKVIETISK